MSGLRRLKRGLATALCGSLVLNMTAPTFGGQDLPLGNADTREEKYSGGGYREQ
ncbi:hypothetical protein [uncultured Clostridium sp.]|uniref:hypothetical protein n=1 Tax=uncultured Clostridium sp. TaxID=59620 RepID=UPI0025F838D1|nr:hypothetical protein [uncultured Clostridium sp.]